MLLEFTHQEGLACEHAKECSPKKVKQRGRGEKHLNLFEHLTQTCSRMQSQSEYGGVGCAGGEYSSCMHRPFSVCAENPCAPGKGLSWLERMELPSMCELSRFVHVNSHPMRRSTMNPGGEEIWERFSSCLVEEELQREYEWRRERGGSANIG